MILRSMARKAKAIDPEGHRLLGLSLETDEPIFAPKGHSLLLSANGGGKTTKGGMPWLFSLAASEPDKAIVFFDNKNGEGAIQAAHTLAEMGRKVAVIDDMRVWRQLQDHYADVNPFGSAVGTYLNNPPDVIFANELITESLIPEPNDDAKNRYFREWPKKLIDCSMRMLLKRSTALCTPGGCADLLSDSDMLLGFAEIEAEEGDPALAAQARSILAMRDHEHWPQHLEEAQRALRHFGPGTRLHDVGRNATLSHSDLVREGYIIFLVGPQSKMTRLGSYYALHIMAFCDALYQGAGALRVIADEFTNCPLKSLVEALTTLRAFGGEVHMIAQSRSEIIRKFGEQETQTIEENAIVKQWFGFSSFEEAERVSKAMGEEHAVATGLSGDNHSLKSQTSLSLIKQRHMTPAELMAMPPDQQLIHIKGVGFFLALTISQAQIAPYCDLIAPNPLEGGKLPSDPKITLVTPRSGS